MPLAQTLPATEICQAAISVLVPEQQVGIYVSCITPCDGLQNAYNIPALINPTRTAGGEAHTAGTTCGTPVCKAYDLPTWCKAPNYIGQADNACINVDGGVSPPTNKPSDGTRQIKAKYPDAISYPPDTTGTVHNCATGSDYEVVFCP